MKLETYLTTLGISHTAFAEKLGVTQVTVTRYANGQRRPSLKAALKIEELTKRKVRVSDWYEVEQGGETAA